MPKFSNSYILRYRLISLSFSAVYFSCQFTEAMAAYCFGAFFDIKTLLGLEVSNLLSRRKITLCPHSRPFGLPQRMTAQSPKCRIL